MRDDFSLKTKEELAKRVAYKCSNPQCRKPTIGANDNSEGTVSIGEASHICAAAPGGKRYDINMSSEERASINNGIWLCRNCVAMIDRDENFYSVELLQTWKRLAEIEANQNIAKNRNFTEQISLSNNDRMVVEHIIQIMEQPNTPYMLREHDFREDFQRDYLNPLFSLIDYLKQPSAVVLNEQLREKIQVLLGVIEDFRCHIALKGGPSKYGNGSYIIDFVEDQREGNELCDLIWKKYENVVSTYRMLG